MLRLDKFLCDAGIGSRSQVKVFLKQGLIKVNGEIIKRPEFKVEEEQDSVTFQGKEIKYRKYVYYMLNKPKGVVSATRDNLDRTVTDLIKDSGHQNLFPVGRLDKDTEGLLIMTNDGDLAHRLLSPKKHVDKVYYVELDKMLTEEGRRMLETGIDIGEEKPTLPANAQRITDTSLYLTIREGKYHQVKRMLKAVGCEVTYLKRIAMGAISLDKNLPCGCYRELTEEERKKILL
ncbi:MAG: rRNA pseudouridine synthase [Lachnospiraceae bacterium]|jgi:16S rRNA pseudouridine516 synthase|nr:rRNA pseudouridine synthase [Lachnospiraceae bacterium]